MRRRAFPAFPPISLLMNRSGPQRWEALPAALNTLGADVVQLPTPDSRRPALLFHLLNQNCRGLPEGTGFGFYIGAGTIKLDSPAGCGALAGNPLLKSVEGGDPFAMSAQTYAAAERKCAEGGAVMLTTADGRTLSAVCAAPLPPAPRAFVVRIWLPRPPT